MVFDSQRKIWLVLWILVGVIPWGAQANSPSETPANQQRVTTLLVEARRPMELSVYKDAKWALSFCESAAQANLNDRQYACQRAEQAVAACLAFRTSWQERKMAVLLDVDKMEPGIGVKYVPGLAYTNSKNEGRKATNEELWSDAIKTLRSKEAAPCDTQLPTLGGSPADLLTERTKQEQTQTDSFKRCDTIRRNAFAALDDNDKLSALQLANELKLQCAALDSLYGRLADDVKRQANLLSTSETKSSSSASVSAATSSSELPSTDQSTSSTPSITPINSAAQDSDSPVLLKRRGGDATAMRLLQQSLENNQDTLARQAAVAKQAAADQAVKAASPSAGSPSRNAAAIKSCDDVVAAFRSQIGADEAYQRTQDDIAAGKATEQMKHEQVLWYRERMMQLTKSHPACSNDLNAQQQASMGIQQSQQYCNCMAGTNRWFSEARVNTAIADLMARSSERTSADVSTATTAAVAFESCERDAKVALDFSSSTDTVLFLRRIIAGTDRAINIFEQCESDPRAQQQIKLLKEQRANALTTCRQLAATDNCERSPL